MTRRARRDDQRAIPATRVGRDSKMYPGQNAPDACRVLSKPSIPGGYPMADRANEQRRSSSKGYGGLKTTRGRSIADEPEKAKAEARARAKVVRRSPQAGRCAAGPTAQRSAWAGEQTCAGS